MEGESDGSVRSVERALALIKLLRDDPRDGWRLSDLSSSAGLGKSTAHRLLNALVEQGFAYQEPKSRRYYLGFEMTCNSFENIRGAIINVLSPILSEIIEETEDVAYLQLKEGGEAVCVERYEGSFPIKSLTLDVGDRRPLGVGAGSLALLAALPDEEIDVVIRRNNKILKPYSAFTTETLRTLVEETREHGFAFNDGKIVPGMGAIGVAVLNSQKHPIAAISVAAIVDRMNPARRLEIARAISTKIKGVRKQLAQFSEHKS
ncbi:IclR family transcriptional regulator [Roseovarius sp. CAU 1744]|uniref:IclR family transcriptional regulator n=1 Tax=Roseovarius sp. CAU 1744 TaxID=3140368 RepID=UPI00325A468D